MGIPKNNPNNELRNQIQQLAQENGIVLPEEKEEFIPLQKVPLLFRKQISILIQIYSR